MPNGREREASGRPEQVRHAFGDGTVDVVERVAQAHHGLGVPGHIEITGKEQRIAVRTAIEEADEIKKLPRNARVVFRLGISCVGLQNEIVRVGTEQQHKRQAACLDHKARRAVRAESIEQGWMRLGDVTDDAPQNGLQEKQRRGW